MWLKLPALVFIVSYFVLSEGASAKSECELCKNIVTQFKSVSRELCLSKSDLPQAPHVAVSDPTCTTKEHQN